MKRIAIYTITFITSIINYTSIAMVKNPLLEKYTTPYQTIPFDNIQTEHYFPAFEKGMQEQNDEIAFIINNTEKPTFENTIVALEKSGALLKKVGGVFYNLLQAKKISILCV